MTEFVDILTVRLGKRLVLFSLLFTRKFALGLIVQAPFDIWISLFCFVVEVGYGDSEVKLEDD